ncbi:MAG TPA: aldo/keto reductase [Candidatus Saccharimonadales bacterium]|nr:aldo/keto reductase [Candidatus Saccharimonadales bacterium]
MAETPHIGFEQVPLGDSGMTVSSVGFGTYHLREKVGPSEAIDAMGAAFDAGITLYDTSDNYGTEELVGIAVKEGVLPRDQVVIATKTGLAVSAREHLEWVEEDRHVDVTPGRIREQVEKSLRLLGEDVGIIDLYQLHSYDSEVPPDVPARVLDRLIEEGKIRAYGVSNYPAEGIADMLRACEEYGFTPPVTSQPIANLVYGYDEVAAEIARADGMTTLAHSPLHKGLLADDMLFRLDEMIAEAEKEQDGTDLGVLKTGLSYLDRLQDRAWENDCSLSALAIAWVAAHPDTVVLTSPTDRNRLQDVQDAVSWELDDETMRLAREAREYFAGTDFADFTLGLMRRLKIYYR